MNNQILHQFRVECFSSDEQYKSSIWTEKCLDHSGVFSLEEKPILILINDLDHLQFKIHVSNTDNFISNLVDLYSVKKKLEDNGTSYSFSPFYGFLS